ncbi:VOC family protein [Mariniphaga sediminis]|jgi:lactoylglutathione lyase|uniref:VOC family protein n=1 Tax=Mariniphaga sediminis TaxID=1628158 RepID=UPI003563CC23
MHKYSFHDTALQYFLLFDSDCNLEIMEMPKLFKSKNDPMTHYPSLTHFSIKVGTKTEVNQLTKLIRNDRFKIMTEPRTTGDGFYESTVLDPDGNQVEIAA